MNALLLNLILATWNKLLDLAGWIIIAVIGFSILKKFIPTWIESLFQYQEQRHKQEMENIMARKIVESR